MIAECSSGAGAAEGIAKLVVEETYHPFATKNWSQDGVQCQERALALVIRILVWGWGLQVQLLAPSPGLVAAGQLANVPAAETLGQGAGEWDTFDEAET